jgi:antitoxin ParD1/3/4
MQNQFLRRLHLLIKDKYFRHAKIIQLLALLKQKCVAHNTSISLDKHFEDFISAKISSGEYSSASEVIRTALWLLEAEELKNNNLNRALLQGEKSGLAKNFNPKVHLKKLRGKFL